MTELLDEKIILKNLILNEQYFNKVFPYIQEVYFREDYTKKIFKCISEYNLKYHKIPNITVISLFVEQVKGVSKKDYDSMVETLEYFNVPEAPKFEWLCDETVRFIKNRKYEDSISDAADLFYKGILDAELPEKIVEALSVTFDSEIGMEFSDAEKRWDAYTLQEDRIPFLVDKLNEATKGGVTRKTLNCLMSSNTGGFKSGTMCSFASDYIRQGYNVLYLTFEMDEAHIFERIDANLLDTEIDDLVKLGKEKFITKAKEINAKSNGRIIAKQFPTSTCNVGHIRSLLKDLKLKKHFIPDVIMFDYIGIMSSMKYKDGNAEHIVLKSIVEEVRGLCVEYNVVGWTAMQSNRSGASAGQDLSISDISASYGTVFGFDLLFGIVTTPELDAEHKISFKQLKNRYSDMNLMPKFILGLNKSKMKIYNITSGAEYYSAPKNEEETRNEDDAERSVFTTRYTRNGQNKKTSTNFVFG